MQKPESGEGGQSILKQLAGQWRELSEVATRLDSTVTMLEHDQADIMSVVSILRNIETAIQKATLGVDAIIAETMPANLQDAAILSAFAWRAHNENDAVVSPSRNAADERIFDEALSKVLTNLMRYLIQTSNVEISGLMKAWCIPHGDINKRRT